MSTALSSTEKLKLVDLELVIERGLQTFVEVGAALSIIREQKLYREEHGTFEEYCQERWGWTRQRSAQLIAASETVGILSTTVDTLPANEAQAREIGKVPEEQRTEVWQEAVETAPKNEDGTPKLTASHVRDTVDRHVVRPTKVPRLPDKPKSKTDQLREARERAYEQMQAGGEATSDQPSEEKRNGATSPAAPDGGPVTADDVLRESQAETERTPEYRVGLYLRRLGIVPEFTDEEIAQGVSLFGKHAEVQTCREHRDLLSKIIAHATSKEAIRVVR